MSIKTKIKKHLKKENAKWPLKLKLIPESDWPKNYCADNIKELWRSRNFLVQIFDEGENERISVITTSFKGERWVDGIKWDDLQRLKKECGRGEYEIRRSQRLKKQRPDREYLCQKCEDMINRKLHESYLKTLI